MGETIDPYRAPESNLASPSSEPLGGSIENTLNGFADLDVGSVFSEAWQKTSGIKGYVVGGGLLLYAGVLVVSLVIGLIFGLGEQVILGTVVSQLIIMMMIYPFMAGVILLGLHHSVGMPVSFGQQFNQYGMLLPIVAVAVLQTLASLIGFVLLILPGIYIAIALNLAIPLKVEKQMGVVESLITSLQLVNKKFLNVAVLAIVASLVMSFSFITIIGWIWAVPWMLMVFAITYRQLAGVEVTS